MTFRGVIVCHVDDFLHAGEPVFDNTVMSGLRGRFLAGKLEETTFKYVGFNVHQSSIGVTLDQNDYVESINSVSVDPSRTSKKLEKLTTLEHTDLRTLVGHLNWAVQGSRPDLAFDIVDLSTRFKTGTVNDLLRAKKAIRKPNSNQKSSFLHLVIPSFGKSSCFQMQLMQILATVSAAWVHIQFFLLVQEIVVAHCHGQPTRSNELYVRLLQRKPLVYRRVLRMPSFYDL